MRGVEIGRKVVTNEESMVINSCYLQHAEEGDMVGACLFR